MSQPTQPAPSIPSRCAHCHWELPHCYCFQYWQSRGVAPWPSGAQSVGGLPTFPSQIQGHQPIGEPSTSHSLHTHAHPTTVAPSTISHHSSSHVQIPEHDNSRLASSLPDADSRSRKRAKTSNAPSDSTPAPKKKKMKKKHPPPSAPSSSLPTGSQPFGVGITGSAPLPPQAFSSSSTIGSLASSSKGLSSSTATDVWHFARALKTDKAPDTVPLSDSTPLKSRPDSHEFSHLGCKLCK